MSSANESKSLPIGLGACSIRAEKPSKKSNTAPSMINNNASVYRYCVAITLAMHPDIKLPHVNVLGIMFFILMRMSLTAPIELMIVIIIIVKR